MNNITFSNTYFFVGIDTHLKNWRVTIRNSGLELKTFSMNPSPEELYKYLTTLSRRNLLHRLRSRFLRLLASEKV